jgi:DNA-binding MarR family transcriptional regulator
MEAMTRPSSPEGTGDARIKEQARELQALFAQLLEHPIEPHPQPLADVELLPREAKMLMVLGDKGEMIMTDLASALRAPLSTVTRIVDRLEKQDFVERSRSDEDRRIVVVKQREKGKMLHDSFRQCQLDMAERMLEPLSKGEREILLELMGKLVRALTAPQV